MKNWKSFPRALFFLTLLLSLLAGLSAPALVSQSASAAPMRAAALDVIINEVAWAGTSSANTSDEWIELYNPTGADISLSGWTLSDSTDGSGDVNINLSGTIPSFGYFLLERDDDNTISDIAADQIYSGNLTNSPGETLTLIDNLSNPIDSANGDGGGWNGGSASPNYYSMVRIGLVADSDTAWTSNNGIDRNGLAANGTTINGTPYNSKTDLSLSMIVNNPSPNVGDNVIFTVVVSNAGFGTATNVSVKDTLLAGLTYQSHSVTTGSFVSSTGIWTVGSLTTGASETLTIEARVDTTGAKKNWAEVWTSSQADPDSTVGNGSATEDDYASASVFSNPVSGTADISVALSVNNTSPNVNDSIVFTITASNGGTDPATGVIISDVFPLGCLVYVSATGSGTYNSLNGEWAIPSIAVGASVDLKITARVVNNSTTTTTASVVSLGQNDPDPSNDSYSVTVTPSGGLADLSLTQESPIKSGVAGQVVLKITVANRKDTVNGYIYNATNVVVKDDLPTGLTYVSDDSGGAYNKDTGLWSAGSILLGAEKSLKITVKVDPTGTMDNEAEIWSVDQTDPNSTPGNGSTTEDDDDVVTVYFADLSITKSMDNVIPDLDTDVVFTIRVSNAGPDIAKGVQVKDLLNAAQYLYLSDDSGSFTSGLSYTSSSGIWNIDEIAVGGSKTLKITATVKKVPVVVNWAEISASTLVDIDSVPGDGSTNTDDDASAPSSDLRLDLEASKPYPGLNTSFTYKITVTNDGTVGATGVQVKDKLPSGITYGSNPCALNTVGTCTYTSSTGIIWTIPTLASGESKAVTLTFNAQMTSSGVRTNWAEVWKSNLPDPDSTPGNASTTEDDDASATVSFRPILINEVAWAGTSASLLDDQWIELYNPSAVDVNITGWILKTSDGTPNITLSGTIAAGGFFLLERDNNYTVSDIAANQIYTGALSTSGETLILCTSDTISAPCIVTASPTPNVIDTANISGGGWPKGGGTNYASMERQGNTAESDSVWVTNTGVTKNGKNANGGNIYGTPGKKNSTGALPTATVAPPSPTPIPPEVRPILNEFLPRPGYDWNQDGKLNVFDEFIEIKNIGVVDVNMTGWKLDDEANSGSAPFSIPALTLKPGQRAIFYGLQTNILLSDGGDTVRLINPSGKIYDAYTYAIATTEDQSVCRLPDGNGSWYEDCVPTPNLLNSREGSVPSMPDGENSESPVCALPDTLPADFLFAECRGYGSDIWHSFYWDEFGWQGDQTARENMSKWESFVE